LLSVKKKKNTHKIYVKEVWESGFLINKKIGGEKKLP